MLLRYLELTAVAIVFLAFVTQIVVPALRGTPLLPFLRTEKHLVADLARANEEVLQEALRNKIEQRHKKAENLRKQRHVVSPTGSAEVPQISEATKKQ